MQASKPLNRKFAIVLALASLWLLSCIGIVVFIHSDDWWFFNLHSHDATTIEQIGAFFLTWTGAQLPAASFAGMIIGSSDFGHPLRTTFWATSAYYLVLSAIRAVHWPWKLFHNLDQSIPIFAYLISMSLLIGFSIFVTWLMPRFHRIFQKYFAH